MATIQLPLDFKEFLKLENLHQVEYLLVGGYAVGYHGYPRATGDMDLWGGSPSPQRWKTDGCLLFLPFSRFRIPYRHVY